MIRSFDRWLPAYFRQDRRRLVTDGALQVFIAVCDHFEPFHDTDRAGALEAMEQWARRWPEIVDSFRDSSGRGPRHTFFYPVEQYDEEVIGRLAAICKQTGSEVEVHLHHEGDTSESLTEKLERGTANLASHGLLSRDANGVPAFGFIHGDWALDHSHPEGLHCGVADELRVLRQTGCYADFTMPSAPSPTQTRTINSIYYAKEDGRAKSHDLGQAVTCESTLDLANDPEHLLLVQGPLGLNWQWRKWGIIPRVENGDLTRANPPTMNRFELWNQLCPSVKGGPPWVFVKLHTHGGIPRNYEMLLGAAAHEFHAGLRDQDAVAYHYVTAREMVNLIHAAEGGNDAPINQARDWKLSPPPIAQDTGSKMR